MNTQEAKKWLMAVPTARPIYRYIKESDKLITLYAPNLNGHDVMIKNSKTEFKSAAAAINVARKFQKEIRKNHPEVTLLR